MDRQLITGGGLAALLGVCVGGGYWALNARADGLVELDTRLGRVPTRMRSGPDRPSEALARLQAAPLLGGSEKVSQAPEVLIQLFGISRRPGRNAALLAIAGGPAQWLSLGEAQGDVTLDAVSATGAVLTTSTGLREVTLGMANTAGSAGASEAAAAGFRSPPPPANAPGVE